MKITEIDALITWRSVLATDYKKFFEANVTEGEYNFLEQTLNQINRVDHVLRALLDEAKAEVDAPNA